MDERIVRPNLILLDDQLEHGRKLVVLFHTLMGTHHEQ